MDSHGQSPRDDEFLRRLKDLGYLGNPLEKFFIGGTRGRTGVLVANLKIAAKVGVLGGVFLGVVTAAGLALLSPEVFPTLAAAATLALYFSLVFTVLFTALQLVIGLVVTLLGRVARTLFTRTEMIALYSGVFAALVVLVYGTLWWWTGPARSGGSSARAAAAFVVIAALAAGIGLLTRLAVRALLALLGGADLTARGKGRATRLYFAVLVFGILFFVGWHAATTRPVPMEASAFDARPAGLSVTLVAIDGAGIDAFEYVTARGIAPNLSRLAGSGWVARLEEPALHVNPAVWTTVATGVGPGKHGVTSYSAQEIPGLGFYIKDRVGFGLYDAMLAALPAVGLSERAPLERRGVSFPALWDILAAKGDLSGVVNWWGTWPAATFHGFLVTDRMYPKLQVAKATGEPPLFESEVYPPVLFDALASYPATGAKISDDPRAAAEDMDRFAAKALAAGAAEYPSTSLDALYLPGLDVYENALYSRVAPGWNVADAARVADGLEDYWRFLDELLAPVAASADASHVVIVVADPGMLKPAERASEGRTARGFVIISGGPSRAARAATPARTR